MKCVVNLIPLRICVRSRNTQPHLEESFVTKKVSTKKKILLYKPKTKKISFVRGGGGFHRSWDHFTQEIFSLLRALTNEAERTLDLPKHGAARACPWLPVSTVLVAASVPRGR